MPKVRRSALVLGVFLVACGGGGEEPMEQEPIGGEPVVGQAAGPGDVACEPTATGEELTGRQSPYDSTTIRVGEGLAKVCYSRPALRGRTMIGGEAVPYDTLWRTGANEPTIIHLTAAAEIAGLPVEPGSYSLYTVPRESGPWTVIVNRSTSQWGHESRYTPEVRAQEVGRAQVESEQSEAPIEQFTIRPMEGDGGLILEWQNARVRVPIRPAS